MRRIILIGILACMLIAPALSMSVQADESIPSGWTVSVKPIFAFSGDTVNVTISANTPGQAAFMHLKSPNGTTSYFEDSFTLNDMGAHYVNMTLPFDLPSGIYNITVMANTGEGNVEVARTSLDITLDQIIYMGILHQQDVERMNKQDLRIDRQNVIIGEHQKQIDELTKIAVSAAMIAIGIAALFIWLYKDFIKDHAHMRTKRGILRKAAKGIDFFLNPGPKGTVEENVPGVKENLERMIQADAGTIIRPTLIIPEPASDIGYLAKEVNLMDSSSAPSKNEIEPLVAEPKRRGLFHRRAKIKPILVRKSVAQVWEQVESLAPTESKKVVIQKPVIVHPIIKKEADPFDLDTIFDRAHAFVNKPEPYRGPPVIIPYGLSPKEHTEMVLKAQKEGKRCVDGLIPFNLEPLIVPWNASTEYREELMKQAKKERRKLVDEPRPANVVEHTPAKRKRKLAKSEGVAK